MSGTLIVTTKPCIKCGETSQIEILKDSYVAWKAGEKVQHAFPTLTPDERELLMTGIHPKCWEEMFGKEEESDSSNRRA
jgi:hypothetical protein